MITLINAREASKASHDARVAGLEAAAGANIAKIITAIADATNTGQNYCKISLKNVRTASGTSIITLLEMRGYDVANTSSINPQSPFELYIRWAD